MKEEVFQGRSNLVLLDCQEVMLYGCKNVIIAGGQYVQVADIKDVHIMGCTNAAINNNIVKILTGNYIEAGEMPRKS